MSGIAMSSENSFTALMLTVEGAAIACLRDANVAANRKNSFKPWGEAEILWTSAVLKGCITSGGIRFVSANMALVEGLKMPRGNG